MCGIFGYIGDQEAQQIVVDGLQKLEYRGYDSAGLASLYKGHLHLSKAVGKIRELEMQLQRRPLHGHCMIGHTRWATHGVPNEVNAHPHVGWRSRVAIVHNGIIENHDVIRKRLKAKGISFISETDTEVVAHLFDELYEGDIVRAFRSVIEQIEGSYALALVHVDYPDTIFAYAKASPLIVGLEKFAGASSAKTYAGIVASDLHALVGFVDHVMFLKEGELAILTPGQLRVVGLDSQPMPLRLQGLQLDVQDVSRGHFEHFMIKEIFEQPSVVRAAMAGRHDDESFTGIFHEIKLDRRMLHRIQRVQIVACGSSWHAGLLGSAFLQEWARIPCDVEIASELRYKNPIIVDDTLVIAISQSGETADTLAAVREMKSKGVHVASICNVEGSTLDREADSSILLHCGPEVSVASTKAFTAQVVVLALFALMMARLREMDRERGRQIIQALKELPGQIQHILDRSCEIEQIVEKYAKFDQFFFIGRRFMVPVAFEGALKIKEVSYVSASGYPAGELKHGAIALIDRHTVTVALCACKQVYEKMLANMAEIKARQGRIIAIVEQRANSEASELADHLFCHPSSEDPLNTILSGVVTQLLAYHMARLRGEDVDQPRNLAKSVTVE